MKKLFLIVLALSILSLTVLAHSDENDPEKKFYDTIKDTSVNSVIIAAIVLGLLTVIAIHLKTQSETTKWILFLGMIVPAILSTLYISAATVYLNVVSETKGPVHWHADFEIWNCGENVDLRDPTGLLNRIGSPKFHEHNDNRMHVEGTILKTQYVDLRSFVEVVGGTLEKDYAAFPINDGYVEMRNGQTCNGEEGKLQVFVYRITNPNSHSRSGFNYEQIKIDDYEEYILSPYINVPPGDCIVVEFGPEKESTDKLCESYRVAESRGDISKI